ncbi:precorrin-4 C(11)-methyltransferase [Desulfotalea psychrophila]|uniref:Probable precorrin-4 C11-methyltransferase (CobM) n=1 Tax=Desulfotalea psychrophila (strain LSv54 / DSM 12343) TaxID=177439 RepID=Q6ARS4_DESPS|nr:precorrin-4 C(11)-methyltransferase [Desulfotalea psychrophila]CAG34951.1 probable precorrin-4 C11-methyltransferase (CobM) [Desulfotalea psychrophila LSv54]
MREEKQTVYFVGAGPGDPELITVKGQRLLQEADLIIYTGSLVPRALVENLAGESINSAPLNLDEVFTLIKTAHAEGKRIVRLHTGDSAIFGAINEQLALLRAHSIPFQVIPGVSSALATAAALETQLTLPEVAQTVIFTRRAGRTPVPAGEDLISLARHGSTMMIFLSISMISEVVAELLEGGYPVHTPAAVVEKASWPEERILRGTLTNIAQQVKDAGITKTALIAVGPAISLEAPEILSKLYDRGFSHEYRQAKP